MFLLKLATTWPTTEVFNLKQTNGAQIMALNALRDAYGDWLQASKRCDRLRQWWERGMAWLRGSSKVAPEPSYDSTLERLLKALSSYSLDVSAVLLLS